MQVSVTFNQNATAASRFPQASMRLRLETDQRLEFSLSPWRAAFPVLFTIPFAIAFLASKGPQAWYAGAIGVAAGGLLTLGLLWWQEALTLDLVARTYAYRRGYWPNLKSDEGALADIKSVALDVQVRTGSKGGDIITWIVSLLFADPAKSIAVASFSVERLAYERWTDLARRLGLPALDRTTSKEHQVAAAEIDKPLAARTDLRQVMPLQPDGSRITLSGDQPTRRIVLPRSGFGLNLVGGVVMPLVGLWWIGALRNAKVALPFYGVSVLFALGGVMAALIEREIEETSDCLIVGTRLFGLRVSKQQCDKSAIVDVEVKPVPGRRFAREVQLRTATDVINLRATRLSESDLDWLAQAILAMVRAS